MEAKNVRGRAACATWCEQTNRENEAQKRNGERETGKLTGAGWALAMVVALIGTGTTTVVVPGTIIKQESNPVCTRPRS